MHLRDMFIQQGRTFSFEFFPPKSETAAEKLYESITELEALRPTFVSVTYGAGGSTRERTHDLVIRLKRETPLVPTPHLTSVGHNDTEIGAILERYAEAGIGNIVALRGDAPKNGGAPCEPGSFRYAAELVRFIRRFNERGLHPDRRGFGVFVAGYPEGHPGCPNRLLEMDHLKAKVDAGADAIITQLFFDNRDFFDFRERCAVAGISVPIIAGLMPITSVSGMRRMAELAGCARFPAGLLRAIARTDQSDEAVSRVGVHWATEQSRDLLDHAVDGIHFYTLNKSPATRLIYETLGVKDSLALVASP
jgi:methylenetetrahydrofolate reductase (NADPH)